MRARMPSQGASISTVVFAASTSAMHSPLRTSSPTSFSHSITVPSVIPIPAWGSRTSVATGAAT
jgi:hypothetical protein